MLIRVRVENGLELFAQKWKESISILLTDWIISGEVAALGKESKPRNEFLECLHMCLDL